MFDLLRNVLALIGALATVSFLCLVWIMYAQRRAQARRERPRSVHITFSADTSKIEAALKKARRATGWLGDR